MKSKNHRICARQISLLLRKLGVKISNVIDQSSVRWNISGIPVASPTETAKDALRRDLVAVVAARRFFAGIVMGEDGMSVSSSDDLIKVKRGKLYLRFQLMLSLKAKRRVALETRATGEAIDFLVARFILTYIKE